MCIRDSNTILAEFFARSSEKNPPFVLKEILDSEKLTGHRNFKTWNVMIRLNLQAFNLLPYIDEETPARKCVADKECTGIAVSKKISITFHSPLLLENHQFI